MSNTEAMAAMDEELSSLEISPEDVSNWRWEQDDNECDSDLDSPHFTDGNEEPPCGGTFPVVIRTR